VGWRSDSPSQHVDVLIDNSEIVASYQLWFNHNINTTDGAYYTIRDSGLYANKLLHVYGRVQADFENSILASQVNLTPTKLQIGNKYKDFGYLRFSNGSHLYLDQINPEGVFCIFTLYFNDAVWETGNADTALKVVYNFLPDYSPERIKIVLEEGGVKFPVANGNTLTVTHNIEGVGGFTKTGEGTIVFDTWTKWGDAARTNSLKWTAHPVTWSFDGEADIKEGKLVVKEGSVKAGAKIRIAENAILESEGASLTNAVLRGNGKVIGGELVGCTVKAPLNDNGSVNADNILTINASVKDRLYFDIELPEDEVLSSPYPSNILLAKWEGDTKVDVSKWRIKGLPGNLTSQFTANDDGTITGTIKAEGMFLLIK
jgi:hypothetical protein